MSEENGAIVEDNASENASTESEQAPARPVDSDAQTANQASSGEQMYSSDELKKLVDQVVKQRIDKQNTKHAGALAEKDEAMASLQADNDELKKQLAGYEAKAARETAVQAAAKASGLSVAQVALLKGDTEEELVEAANAFKAVAPPQYPYVEENNVGANSPLSKEDILAIKNTEERIAAMGKHPELFK